MRAGALGLAVLALTAAGCHDLALVAAPEVLHPREKAIAFPDAFLGATSHATLHLQNDAPGTHRATLIFPDAGAALPVFSSATTTVTVPGGGFGAFNLMFSPATLGTAFGQVLVAADDAAPVAVTLSGTGLAPLECSTPPECQLLTFDPNTGTCVSAVVPDGTACADACLTDSTCQGGRCTGQAIDCDDHDPCTEDVCEPGAGCLHLATLSACPPSPDPCQVPSCSPATGCSTAPAPDGTACGDVDCVVAHVCLNGTCQVQAVPEGAACGDPTPCQPSGQCHSGQCGRGEPGATNEAWEQALDPNATLHWLALSDADDDLYWAQVEQDGLNNTQFTLVSVSRDGFPRYTVNLGAYAPGQHAHDVNLRMVGLLHDPLVVVFGQPSLLQTFRQDTGQPGWSADFSDLVSRSYHPEYFTGEDDVHAAQMVDDGDQLVVSLVGVSHSDATDYSWGTWIRGLSWADGSTLWEWSADGRSRRMVGDGEGNIYEVLWKLDTSSGAYFFANGVTNFGAIADGTVYALSPSGVPLWQHVQTRLLDIAAEGNRLFVDQMQNGAGCLIDQTLEYAAAGTLADDLQTQVPWASFVYDWPMLANGLTYRLAVPSRTDCDAGATDAWLRAFDEATASPAWSFGENLVATNVSAGAIGADGSVLFATSSTDRSTASLRAILADGGEAFECPVVGFSVLTEPVLQTGRWVVGGRGQASDVVISYQMPSTLSPATSGWSASRGNMSRTNRPR